MNRLIALVLAFVVFIPSVADAQIDFESPTTPTACEWGGGADYTSYANYTWTGFRPLSLTNYNTICNPVHGSGYANLATPLNEYIAIGFGVSTITAPTEVRFLGFTGGAGWNNTLLKLEYLSETGWNDLATTNLLVGGYQPFQFDQNVRGLRFIPTFSSNVSEFGGVDYNTFYVDNVLFAPVLDAPPSTVVPEPSSLVLLLVGLAGLCLAANRRNLATK